MSFICFDKWIPKVEKQYQVFYLIFVNPLMLKMYFILSNNGNRKCLLNAFFLYTEIKKQKIIFEELKKKKKKGPLRTGFFKHWLNFLKIGQVMRGYIGLVEWPSERTSLDTCNTNACVITTLDTCNSKKDFLMWGFGSKEDYCSLTLTWLLKCNSKLVLNIID